MSKITINSDNSQKQNKCNLLGSLSKSQDINHQNRANCMADEDLNGLVSSGLKCYCLKEVLSVLPLPSNLNLKKMSSKWRCVIVPSFPPSIAEEVGLDHGDASSSEEEKGKKIHDIGQGQVLNYLCQGVPCKLPKHHSAAVYARSGSNGFDFVSDPRWNNFPKPKIAFKAGWARPGTEFEDDNYHGLINRFSQVFDKADRGELVPIIYDKSIFDEINQSGNYNNNNKEEDAANIITKADNRDPINDDNKGGGGDTHGKKNVNKSVNEEVETSRIDSEEVLILQYFHREDRNSHPPIPTLAKEFLWPTFMLEGAECDNATVVFQRGAMVWWHINDSGEFVMQAALPIPTKVKLEDEDKEDVKKGKSIGKEYIFLSKEAVNKFPELLDDTSILLPKPNPSLGTKKKRLVGKKDDMDKDDNNGEIDQSKERDKDDGGIEDFGSFAPLPVKLIIYGPPGSYDWFIHDDEAEVSGKIVSLDLFDCPDEEVPEGSLLPVLRVVVLFAAGAPLITPPNLPHIEVALNDGVTVEQRRISDFFLDEVSYFVQKVKFWRNNPIIYDYVATTMADENFVCGELIPSLFLQFRTFFGLSGQAGNDAISNNKRLFYSLLATRAVSSLFAIVSFERHYNVPESSRKSLFETISSEPFNNVLTPKLKRKLVNYWDVKRIWAKPGCVLSLSVLDEVNSSSSITKYNEKEDEDEEKKEKILIPVVYRDFKPIFGNSYTNMESCHSAYKAMAAIRQREQLRQFLQRNKKIQQSCEILDELF